jgi:methylenetetrahydrofolate dehydrogenase (NADP+)/methenyltetrahydrofolate cyclohydrolase
VLIAAVGRAELVRRDWVKPGAVVIDVGMNRRDDGLFGDVHFPRCPRSRRRSRRCPAASGR